MRKLFMLGFIVLLSFIVPITNTKAAVTMPANDMGSWTVTYLYSTYYQAKTSLSVSGHTYTDMYIYVPSNYNELDLPVGSTRIDFKNAASSILYTYDIEHYGWHKIDYGAYAGVITYDLFLYSDSYYSLWTGFLDANFYITNNVGTNSLIESIMVNGDTSAPYNAGYNAAVTDFNDTYDILSDTDLDGYDDTSYSAGYNDGVVGDLDLSWWMAIIDFSGGIFGKEIMPNVTIGALASIPIMFAMFKWFMRLTGAGK